MVGDTLSEVAKFIKAGVSTKQLDAIAEDYIRSNGGIPTFKGYMGYPASLCISINEVVVHGIPGDRIIKDGDIVSVDTVALKNGFNGDAARTFLLFSIQGKEELQE